MLAHFLDRVGGGGQELAQGEGGANSATQPGRPGVGPCAGEVLNQRAAALARGLLPVFLAYPGLEKEVIIRWG